jgi:beta-N-acetylhexosaminidase
MSGREARWFKDVGIHLMVGFGGTALGEELKSLIRDFHIGGVVLFRRNVEDPEQLQALLTDAQRFAAETMGRRLWVAIDQEGGPVQRLIPPFIQLPSARNLATQGQDGVSEWSAKAARELHQIGIHINLAPVLDLVLEGQTHFMTERSLGSDPKRVAQLGEVWIKSLQEQGISATAKHFPGLGRAILDPHHYAPVIQWANEAAMAEDFFPFRHAVQVGVHCVMTSHALYPYLDARWPATLSSIINRDWLRTRLEFQGLLLSDDMDMAAVSGRFTFDEVARQGLDATLDFFLLCQQSANVEPLYRALSDAVKQEQHMAELHRRSLDRIARLTALRNNPAAMALSSSSVERTS